MGTKSTAILIVVLFVVVFFLVSAYFGTLPVIMQKIQGGFTQAKTVFQPVVNAWNSIPNNIRNIIMLGIPTLFAAFFAWSKNLWVKKAQQTEEQAATKLTSQAQQYENVISEKDKQLTATQEELTAFRERDTTIAKLIKEKADLQIEAESWKEAAETKAKQISQISADYQLLLKTVQPKDPLLKQ